MSTRFLAAIIFYVVTGFALGVATGVGVLAYRLITGVCA